MKNALRVAAYARVSTEGDDQANSFESQVRYFTEYINRHENWHLVKVYSDEGITGTTTRNRIGFNTMIEDVFAQKIDYIITKEVSRFARNTVDTLQVTRALKERGVGVYFMLDNIDTLDKDGEIRLTLIASLAQEESRKTSERVKWGQKRQMEKGVVFGRSLLGYRVENGKLFLKEDEAEIVRLIFDKYVNEEKGTHIIARELKEAGIRPYNPDGCAKHKNEWSSTAILRILRNEKYVGDLKQKKTYTQNFLDHKRCRNDGQEEMIYIRDHHPESAIISREMWDAAQSELERRQASAKLSSRHSAKHWVSGKVFCGECGEKFVCRRKRNKNSENLVWSCVNHVKATHLRRTSCSLSEWVNDRSLRKIVMHLLSLLVADRDCICREIANDISDLFIQKTPNFDDMICRNIGKLEARLHKLIDIRLDGEISQEEFKAKKKELDDEIARLSAARNSSKSTKDTELSEEKRHQSILSAAHKLLNFSDDRADLLLRSALGQITVFENRKVIVKLNALTDRFEVNYTVSGRGDGYRTDILDIALLQDPVSV